MRNNLATGYVQKRIYRNSWTTVALIVVTSVFLWSSLGLSRVSAWIPRLILSGTLVLLLLQLAKEFAGTKQAVLSMPVSEQTGMNSMLPALAWIGTTLLSVWLFGMSMGAALFCLAYLRFHAGERWPISVAFALGLGLGVQLLFGTFMQITLYQGIVLPLLMSKA